MSEPKRFKRGPTLFEDMPNELFVEIFGYLDGVDTIYAFSRLNIRLQGLLHNYVNIFDFQSVSKAKFTFVTQSHDICRWRSLRLSDGDETPGQIRLFCHLFPPAQYLHQLQVLTAWNMTPTYGQEFLCQIKSFGKLVSLSIGHICGLDMEPVDLPSLKHLHFISCKHTDWLMTLSSLESVEYTIECRCHSSNQPSFPVTLKKFRIFYSESKYGNDVRGLLRSMSSLTTLALCSGEESNFSPDGRFWEDLIVSSLPLLTTFQFFFSFRVVSTNLPLIMDSYSTPFYLLEKRWFSRCDQCTDGPPKVVLYSLPFAFSRMSINTNSFETSFSNLPTIDLDESKSSYYTKVNTLAFNAQCDVPHLGFLSCNIHSLILNVNLPKNWLYLLKDLRHLVIESGVSMSSSDFVSILKHAPNLQKLTIPLLPLEQFTNRFTDQVICEKLSQQIRSLVICRWYEYQNFGRDVVSVRTLSAIARVFATKCEHLSLALRAHPRTFRQILRRMKSLRSLHIHASYPRVKEICSSKDWLRQDANDPTASDFVYTDGYAEISVWYGNRL